MSKDFITFLKNPAIFFNKVLLLAKLLSSRFCGFYILSFVLNNTKPMATLTVGDMSKHEEMKTKSKPLSTIINPVVDEKDNFRRKCGCLRTSEKLKVILKQFPPNAPPASPNIGNLPFLHTSTMNSITSSCMPALNAARPMQRYDFFNDKAKRFAPEKPIREEEAHDKGNNLGYGKGWRLVSELAQLVQLSITATALIFYYIIYCYMQLVYFTLKSALYFHQADGPMKITIAIVTITSFTLGFHLLWRLQRIIFTHF